MDDRQIIRTLRYTFNDDKFELVTFLEQLGLKVPVKSTYSQILDRIRSTGWEEKFARAVFHVDDLESAIRIADITQALSTLTLRELKSLASELSDRERKWKFRKTPKTAIVHAITRNCNRAEIDSTISKLVDLHEIELYQAGKWVIGPLGITESVEDRDTFDVSILDFMQTHFDEQISQQFLSMSSKLSGQKQKAHKKSEMHQLILTHHTTAEIIAITNLLVAERKLSIDAYEDYDTFSASSGGLFQQEDTEPLVYLADILLGQFDQDELRRDFELPKGDLKQCLMEKLLLAKPDDVLDHFFGIAQLKKIAKGLNLVAVDDINDKRKVIELLLLRMGFDIPATPRGITYRLSAVSEAIKKVREMSFQEQRGIVTSSFVDLESILKDVICFYSMAFWEKEIEDVQSTEEASQLLALEKFLSRKFPSANVDRPLHRLTFGQLKILLFAVCKTVVTNSELSRKTSDMLGRENLLTDAQVDLLDSASKLRAKFAHDTGEHLKSQDSLECLSTIQKLLKTLLVDGTYPIPISIRKLITNEYGVTYYEGVDEINEEWIIMHTSRGFEAGFYLMKGNKPISIDPVIVERFWARS
jgi:hypothetical protein